jgi:hypothetical protein
MKELEARPDTKTDNWIDYKPYLLTDMSVFIFSNTEDPGSLIDLDSVPW